MENFAVYLLIGNIFITFWNDGTSMGMDSLLSRAGLITKINFPRYVVLISSTGIAVVNFFINCVVVAIFMYVSNVIPSLIHVVWFFFCSFILYLLILVVSMFLSIIYVRLRDLKQIWELFNQILFWSTPVFYNYFTVSQNSSIMETLLSYVNPVSVLLVTSRNGLMNGDIILHSSVFMWIGIIFIVGGLGYLFYKKQIKKIAEFF
jgi:ABC-2 type transport system permease protein